MKKALKRAGALLMVLQLLSTALPGAAHAVIITTSQVLDHQERADRISRIDLVLAREDVRKQFVAMGVDPDDARRRVASLTDEELGRLEAGIGDLPVGGDSVFAVLGIVFLVLLVLEIVGVINIFNKV